MKKSDDIEKRVASAIELFWLTRDKQRESQGAQSGQKDAGLGAAVTGGKHLDGFIDICRDLFINAGVPEAHVFWRDRKELPGYYRAKKNWDLIVVADAICSRLSNSRPKSGRRLATISITALKKPSATPVISGQRTAREHLSHQCDLGLATSSSSKIANARTLQCESSNLISKCSTNFRMRPTPKDTSYF